MFFGVLLVLLVLVMMVLKGVVGEVYFWIWVFSKVVCIQGCLGRVLCLCIAYVWLFHRLFLVECRLVDYWGRVMSRFLFCFDDVSYRLRQHC